MLFKQKAKADYLFSVELVGKRLYAARKAKRESPKTVAKVVGISAGTIRKMEKGLFHFCPFSLFRLCKYYGVSLSYIFRYNEIIVEEVP